MNRRETLNSRLRFLRARLEELQRDAEDAHNESIAGVIDQLHEEEKRNKVLRVGITGYVGVGKSTFINQLLGCDILPEGAGSVTATPTYISRRESPLFRAEFHFVSQKTVEEELALLVELQEKKDDSSDAYKVITARLLLLFKGLRINDNYAELEPLPFHLPELLMNLVEGVGGGPGFSDFRALEDAKVVVDLVGAKPLIIECESPEDLAAVYADIVSMLHHVDIFGPFLNLPSDVVIVDTPGLGDKNVFKSEQTLNAINTLDEMWVMTRGGEPLELEREQQFIQEAHSCHVAIRVIVSHIDHESTEGDDNRRVLMNKCLTESLNPEPNELSNRILTDEERADTQEMVNKVTQEASFWRTPESPTPAIHPGIRLLRDMGNVVADRVDSVADALQEIEANAFLENEPSLLPDDIAQELIAACNIALDECNISDDDVTAMSVQIYNHCMATWPNDGRTITAIMRDTRSGVFLESRNGSFDLMRDIAQKWASLMNRKGHALQAAVREALQPASDLDMDDTTAQKVKRRVTRLQNDLTCMLNELLTARVRGEVERYMKAHHFFWSGPYGSRGSLCTGLPRHNKVAAITVDLMMHLRNGLAQIRNAVITSQLTSPRIHDALTPDLRARLTAILAIDHEVQVAGGRDIDEFLCPISHEPMLDPVRITPCGHTFDRENIENWVRLHPYAPTCPLDRGLVLVEAGVLNCVPNYELRWRYEEYLARHHQAPVDADADVENAEHIMHAWWNVTWLALFNTRTGVSHVDEEVQEGGAQETKGPG